MSALNRQIAGNHYKKLKIQPVEYIHQNGLGFLEGCVVKRITRWKDKDGIQDLEKIIHEVELLIEQEKKRLEQEKLGQVTNTIEGILRQEKYGPPMEGEIVGTTKTPGGFIRAHGFTLGDNVLKVGTTDWSAS